jgi:nicotinamidase-related amidase
MNTTLTTLDPATTALIVIDMQRDFCSPGGYAHQAGLDIARMQAVVGQVKALLVAARAAGLHVFHTREGHLPDLSDCPPAKLARSVAAGAPIGSPGPLGRLLVRGEQGHDFVPELRPLSSEHVIDKPGYGAFHKTTLGPLLGAFGIRRLLLCGVTTEVCVHSTLREAVDRGFVCTTVGDATAASQAELQAPALAMIGVEGGIFGGLCNTAEAVAALNALNALPRATREAA